MLRPILTAFMLVFVFAAADRAAAADTYEIDPVHSFVVFKINHLGASYTWGRFNDPVGSFVVNEDDPSDTRFEVQVDAAKVDTGHEGRDEHLRGPDFFSAKQFPKITFKSTDVSGDGDALEVKGDLTLHGVTKPVTVELERVGNHSSQRFGDRTGFAGEFTIKRSDFGINFMPDAIGDEVTLMVSLEGIKK